MLPQIAARAAQQIDRLCQAWRIQKEIANDIVRLALYDVIIYVDDSGSMSFEENGERIKDLQLILQRSVFAATLFDEDGIEMRFMNEDIPLQEISGIRSEQQVEQILSRKRYKVRWKPSSNALTLSELTFQSGPHSIRNRAPKEGVLGISKRPGNITKANVEVGYRPYSHPEVEQRSNAQASAHHLDHRWSACRREPERSYRDRAVRVSSCSAFSIRTRCCCVPVRSGWQ
jgi:hypothetical protein